MIVSPWGTGCRWRSWSKWSSLPDSGRARPPGDTGRAAGSSCPGRACCSGRPFGQSRRTLCQRRSARVTGWSSSPRDNAYINKEIIPEIRIIRTLIIGEKNQHYFSFEWNYYSYLVSSKRYTYTSYLFHIIQVDKLWKIKFMQTMLSY
jgi:hypothetical protein